jgi:indole-3-glycerol phosphate synthase
MILDEIVAAKRAEVARLRERWTLGELRAEAEAAPGARDFAGALRSRDGSVRLIAEVKRKSPSKGVFRAELDAAQLARTYAEHGAACISVLTDGPFFQGSLDDLCAARAAVELPLLRKEFIIDTAQIYEARAAGADAILLIAAILDDASLAAFHRLAGELGMGALVEVHDEAELRRVLPLQPALIGINNRDLKTFRTDLVTTERLRPLIPAGCVVVGESGIHTREDVTRLRRAGVQAILVGESLIMAADTAAQIRELIGSDA